jgi:hypothetical protein
MTSNAPDLTPTSAVWRSRGTQTSGEAVFLTRSEVAHARRDEDAALFVLREIHVEAIRQILQWSLLETPARSTRGTRRIPAWLASRTATRSHRRPRDRQSQVNAVPAEEQQRAVGGSAGRADEVSQAYQEAPESKCGDLTCTGKPFIKLRQRPRSPPLPRRMAAALGARDRAAACGEPVGRAAPGGELPSVRELTNLQGIRRSNRAAQVRRPGGRGPDRGPAGEDHHRRWRVPRRRALRSAGRPGPGHACALAGCQDISAAQ